MKKLSAVILLFAFCLLAHQGNAQIKFGVKGGLNFNKFSGNLDGSTGWHAGLMSKITIPIVGLGVQPELLYSTAKTNDGSIGYIQIPVNLRFQLLPGPIRPILLAGPYYGYAINFGGSTSSDIFKKSDWGVGIGAGIEISKFQAALKYDFGLQDVTVKDFFGEKNKNNVVRLSLGYFF